MHPTLVGSNKIISFCTFAILYIKSTIPQSNAKGAWRNLRATSEEKKQQDYAEFQFSKHFPDEVTVSDLFFTWESWKNWESWD